MPKMVLLISRQSLVYIISYSSALKVCIRISVYSYVIVIHWMCLCLQTEICGLCLISFDSGLQYEYHKCFHLTKPISSLNIYHSHFEDSFPNIFEFCHKTRGIFSAVILQIKTKSYGAYWNALARKHLELLCCKWYAKWISICVSSSSQSCKKPLHPS